METYVITLEDIVVTFHLYDIVISVDICMYTVATNIIVSAANIILSNLIFCIVLLMILSLHCGIDFEKKWSLFQF